LKTVETYGRQVTASVIVVVLAAAVRPVAQRSADDEARPVLRDGSRVALRHVRVVDGTGALATLNQTLIIESSRIRAVGNADEIDGWLIR
jgi:hypothetical protein